jgi:hypothetical protein
VEARQEQESVEGEVLRHEGKPQGEQAWPGLGIVFDAKATADEFGNFLFGPYIVEWTPPPKMGQFLGARVRWGAGFFVGESLGASERDLLEHYCQDRGLTCMTRRQWLDQVFFRYGYYGYGAVVGFNLPVGLARMATRSGVIKVPEPTEENPKPNYIQQQFAGGLYLVFNEREKKDEPGQWRERAYRPPVMIKPIGPQAAMYRWGFFKGWREKGNGFYAGHFLDLRTLGDALLGDDEQKAQGGRSLRTFGKRFGAQVLATEARGRTGQLNEACLDRAMNDAEAILALYHAEMEEYRKHGIEVPPDHVYSGASLGKANLQGVGVMAPPFLDTTGIGYFADQVLGFGASAFYSGRNEGQIVKTPVPVTYVDFHSMYPAVVILQHLWALMRAEEIRVVDATEETIQLLDEIEPDESSERLGNLRYRFCPDVSAKGQASLRGGILDVWPLTEDWPVRLEFEGPVLVSARVFDDNYLRICSLAASIEVGSGDY